MRRWFSLILTLALTASAPEPVREYFGPVRVDSVSIPLDAINPAVQRVGALLFRGGWEWRSDEPEFGGFSSLRTLKQGFLAVGDTGTLLYFAVAPGGALMSARLAPVELSLPRTAEKRDRDSESLAIDEPGGRYWVGFEFHNMIRRYDLATGRLTGQVAPPLMRDWPNNGGPETIVRLRDGRFIVLSEAGGSWADRTAAAIFSGDPVEAGVSTTAFAYRAPEGYRVTDAAELPDGRVLLLHRRFTVSDGVSAILSIADPANIRADGLWEGVQIARLAPPLVVDNMEGVDVTIEHGETIVWLISDDNFSPLQRTLFLKFALRL